MIKNQISIKEGQEIIYQLKDLLQFIQEIRSQFLANDPKICLFTAIEGDILHKIKVIP